MDLLDRLLERFVSIFRILGAASLTGMMLMTCLDVILRGMGSPILGAVEIVGFMATIVLACALAPTQREEGHIGVDLLVRLFPERVQYWIQVVTSLLGTGLFVIVGWQTWEYADTMRKSGEVSMTLEFPNWIFIFWVSISFFALALVLLFDSLKAFRKAVRP